MQKPKRPKKQDFSILTKITFDELEMPGGTPCSNILKLTTTVPAAIGLMVVSVLWRLKLSKQLNWMSTQYGQDQFEENRKGG